VNEKVIISALLHDVGKLIQRAKMPDYISRLISQLKRENVSKREVTKHSFFGRYFIEKYTKDSDIQNSVLLHHNEEIENADISPNSIAYIIYISDNISAGADRRKNERDAENKKKCEK